jgi:hypothetical protein
MLQYTHHNIVVRHMHSTITASSTFSNICMRQKMMAFFFWQTTSNKYLPAVSLPTIHSNIHGLLLDGCPSHEPLELHGFVDSDWAACPQTHHSFTGTCLCLAGGCIAYKPQLLPNVALSSTEAEYMGACNSGKMILLI